MLRRLSIFANFRTDRPTLESDLVNKRLITNARGPNRLAFADLTGRDAILARPDAVVEELHGRRATKAPRRRGSRIERAQEGSRLGWLS